MDDLLGDYHDMKRALESAGRIRALAQVVAGEFVEMSTVGGELQQPLTACYYMSFASALASELMERCVSAGAKKAEEKK